jgi:hypothetical protein
MISFSLLDFTKEDVTYISTTYVDSSCTILSKVQASVDVISTLQTVSNLGIGLIYSASSGADPSSFICQQYTLGQTDTLSTNKYYSSYEQCISDISINTLCSVTMAENLIFNCSFNSDKSIIVNSDSGANCVPTSSSQIEELMNAYFNPGICFPYQNIPPYSCIKKSSRTTSESLSLSSALATGFFSGITFILFAFSNIYQKIFSKKKKISIPGNMEKFHENPIISSI